METESEQNSSSASGSSSSGGSTRPQISQMSLYERQAVQVRHRCALVVLWYGMCISEGGGEPFPVPLSCPVPGWEHAQRTVKCSNLEA